jgi:uncharacterized protein (TIGR03000 family)
MQCHDSTAAGRWGKTVWNALLVLLGLAATGLPDGRAQMYYSGGFTPRRGQAGQNPSPQTPTPAAPKTPPSYFPDNDVAYPSYYLGESKGPLLPPGLLPYNFLPSSLPWNQAGFKDYNELPQLPQDSSVGEPQKYSLTATPLPSPGGERPVTAVLIAHLPEHAVFWVEGIRTRSTGRTRYFQSPPLRPGQKYNYHVRAAWIEDGRWVSQTCLVPVETGLIQAIYLRPTSQSPAKTARKSSL